MAIRSLRLRLTIWYMSLLTATLAVLGGTAFWLLSYSISHQTDKALRGVAEVMAERSHGGVNPQVLADLDETFRRFFGFSPLARYFRMLDPQGAGKQLHPNPTEKLPLTEETLRNALRGIPTYETVDGIDAYPVRILTLPVMQGGYPVNLVQVGMSLQSLYETRSRFLLIMAGLLPMGLLLAGLGGWLLAHRALKPVDRMTEAADRIGAADLTERLEETGIGDELDRLARTLNRMLGRLDAAFRQVRQFSANASHELQTPLTIMRGEMEVALRSVRTPEEYQEILTSALEEIDRISHLVAGLLLLARTDAGVMNVQRELLDLSELAEEVHDRMEGLAAKESRRLVLGAMEPAPVLADREHMGRLLFNLLENGIKYTEPGGSVTLSVQRFGDSAVLEVADDGIGVSDDDRERIFQPFFRTPEALSRKGVGLGLSIARSICAAHDGSIELESAPGRGSLFRVILPLAAGEDNLIGAPPPLEEQINGSAPTT